MIHGNQLLDGLKHGWCLKAVRLVIESAFGWPDEEFYQRFGVARTTQAPAGRTNWSWYAADIEASMKQLQLSVPAECRQPGDLVFNHQASKPVGHVGLYIGRELVMEVVRPSNRPGSFNRRHICLTPYGTWEPTLIARLPQELPEG